MSLPPEDRESGSGEEQTVQVAWASDKYEAEMLQGLLTNAGIRSFLRRAGIDGPQVGFGLLNPGGGHQRVMVLANQAAEARAVIEEALTEAATDPPEPVNAAHLADARGRRPRGYGLLGAYARIYAFSFGAFVLAFAVFLLVRAL